MFRYVGLAWDDADPATSAQARRIGQAVDADAGWRAALLRPGLSVYIAGEANGINDAYELASGGGVALGRLFRRTDLHSQSPQAVSLNQQDSARIQETAGRALVDDFWGRYVAFLRPTPASTLVLRDPTGTLPCFMTCHAGVTIVFSWLEDALALVPHLPPPRVNWDAMAAHLVMGDLSGRETALEGISQILPGELFAFDGRPPRLLWNAVQIARSHHDVNTHDASVLLRSTVRSCARQWASCYPTVLLRLSGGVDSSILASCLAPGSTGADVLCVNYHSAGSDSDERRYARLAAARAGRDLIERERDPTFRLERIFTIARMPTPVPYIGWMNSTTDARLAAAHGASALFTGAGGDALFFEFARWWPVADYLRQRGVDTGLAAALLDAARLGRVSVWRAMALALQERYQRRSTTARVSDAMARLGPATASHALHLEGFSHPALAHAAELPIGKRTQTESLMQSIGYYDPFQKESVPELVNPLLSQPVVELCLRLPTYLLTQGGVGRALARRAFASDLPAQIAARRSKGGMEEHIKDVLVRNLAVARELLIDGELVRRGLLDRATVETLLSGRPTTSAGPIGQIHAWIAAEAWTTRWTRS